MGVYYCNFHSGDLAFIVELERKWRARGDNGVVIGLGGVKRGTRECIARGR